MREIGDYSAMIFALDAVKVFIQKVVRENSVQIAPNFPAIFLDTFFIDLIENYSVCLLVTKENFKKNTLNMKLCWFIKYIIENNKKDNN